MDNKPYVKGDSIDWECTLDADITDWKIRCQVSDDSGNNIQLATANTGGSDDQIEITDASNGIFIVKVAKDLTACFCGKKAYREIEAESDDSPSKKYTPLQDEFEMTEQTIDWEEPS